MQQIYTPIEQLAADTLGDIDNSKHKIERCIIRHLLSKESTIGTRLTAMEACGYSNFNPHFNAAMKHLKELGIVVHQGDTEMICLSGEFMGIYSVIKERDFPGMKSEIVTTVHNGQAFYDDLTKVCTGEDSAETKEYWKLIVRTLLKFFPEPVVDTAVLAFVEDQIGREDLNSSHYIRERNALADLHILRVYTSASGVVVCFHEDWINDMRVREKEFAIGVTQEKKPEEKIENYLTDPVLARKLRTACEYREPRIGWNDHQIAMNTIYYSGGLLHIPTDLSGKFIMNNHPFSDMVIHDLVNMGVLEIKPSSPYLSVALLTDAFAAFIRDKRAVSEEKSELLEEKEKEELEETPRHFSRVPELANRLKRVCLGEKHPTVYIEQLVRDIHNATDVVTVGTKDLPPPVREAYDYLVKIEVLERHLFSPHRDIVMLSGVFIAFLNNQRYYDETAPAVEEKREPKVYDEFSDIRQQLKNNLGHRRDVPAARPSLASKKEMLETAFRSAMKDERSKEYPELSELFKVMLLQYGEYVDFQTFVKKVAEALPGHDIPETKLSKFIFDACTFGMLTAYHKDGKEMAWSVNKAYVHAYFTDPQVDAMAKLALAHQRMERDTEIGRPEEGVVNAPTTPVPEDKPLRTNFALTFDGVSIHAFEVAEFHRTVKKMLKHHSCFFDDVFVIQGKTFTKADLKEILSEIELQGILELDLNTD